MMNMDVRNAANGWPVIARYLELRKCRQRELAEALSLSPAAITQAKQGDSLLSPVQLAMVVDFLQIGGADLLEFYSSIFNARIIGSRAPRELEKKRFELQLRPQFTTQLSERKKFHNCLIADLTAYEPAFEKLSNFLSRKGDLGACYEQVKVTVDHPLEGFEVSQRCVIVIHCDGYPSAGDTVIACMRDRSFRFCRYLPGDGVIVLENPWREGKSLIWHIASDPGFVCWMRPVLELEIKLRERH